MSTDSTLTLRSPATPERFLEERIRRPTTPAVPSNFAAHGPMAAQAERVRRSVTPAAPPNYAAHGPISSQPPAMNRTTSNHHAYESSAETPDNRRSRVGSMQGHSTTPFRVPNSSASLNEQANVSSTIAGYNGQLPTYIPEYDPSTISELEVQERDRIAQINAGYNAVSSSSSSSYYPNDNVIEPNVRRSPPNQPSSDTFTRVASSQPLHPNLHFPTKTDDFNHTFNSNFTPSILSAKDGSPPLVERVPSQVQYPPTSSQSGQFLPTQTQDGWNRDGVYNSDHTRNPHRPPPPATSNHLFENGSASLPRSSQTTYATPQETVNLNESRPLPVPPPIPPPIPPLEVPRQRRPSVVGPRPDVNALKGVSDVRHRGQTTAREYSYDHSELRRDVRPSPSDLEASKIAARSHLQPAAFVGPPIETESSNDRIRTRSTSFSNSTRPNLPPVNNGGQYLSSSPQQYETPDITVPDRRRVPEQDKHVRTSPPSRMQESSVYHSDYVEPERRNDVRGLSSQPVYTNEQDRPMRTSPSSRMQETPFHRSDHMEPERRNDIRGSSSQAGYNIQPATPTLDRDTHIPIPDPRRVSEQDKHPRTSPPSRMQQSSVYHPDYVEPERRNDVRGSSSQAVYNGQPTTPTSSRDTHLSQRQNVPGGQPSSKSNDRTPSYPPLNSRSATVQEIPNSRSRTSYVEIPATHTNGLPARGATTYDTSSMPVNIGGYSSSSNSTEQRYVHPEQPPQRRYSDGDQNSPRPVESSGRSSAPLVRSVRWTENLVCPSPIFASQRRKGWFNRRG